MLDKFLPPTDNLYKFKAISGLLLMLSVSAPIYLMFLLDTRLTTSKIEIRKHEIERQYDNQAFLDSQNEFESSVNQFKADDAKHIVTPEQREQFIKRTQENAENIRRFDLQRKQWELEQVEWDENLEVSRRLLWAIVALMIFTVVSLVWGAVFTITGFWAWRTKVQEPNDRILAREAGEPRVLRGKRIRRAYRRKG